MMLKWLIGKLLGLIPASIGVYLGVKTNEAEKAGAATQKAADLLAVAQQDAVMAQDQANAPRTADELGDAFKSGKY